MRRLTANRLILTGSAKTPAILEPAGSRARCARPEPVRCQILAFPDAGLRMTVRKRTAVGIAGVDGRARRRRRLPIPSAQGLQEAPYALQHPCAGVGACNAQAILSALSHRVTTVVCRRSSIVRKLRGYRKGRSNERGPRPPIRTSNPPSGTSARLLESLHAVRAPPSPEPG
jgi:hypothetical protein